MIQEEENYLVIILLSAATNEIKGHWMQSDAHLQRRIYLRYVQRVV